MCHDVYMCGNCVVLNECMYAGTREQCQFNPGGVAAKVAQWGYVCDNNTSQDCLLQ